MTTMVILQGTPLSSQPSCFKGINDEFGSDVLQIMIYIITHLPGAFPS
jgi:hypothetical protein